MVNTIKFSQFASANLSNTTNTGVGTNSPTGGSNIQYSFPQTWTTVTRPTPGSNPLLGYNSTLGQYEYWNGLQWLQIAAGGVGTISIGAQNQLAYYAANGTTVSGLSTIASAVLTSTSLGALSWVTYTGTGSPVLNNSPTFVTPNLGVASATSLQFSSTTGIIGTTTNDSAASGSVGQIIFSVIPRASAISLTTNIAANVTSISLTAGDWDIWGNVNIALTGNGTVTNAWISQSSALQPDASLYNGLTFSSGSLTQIGIQIPSQPIQLSSTTTIYLSGVCTFTTGTATACGAIYARRRR